MLQISQLKLRPDQGEDVLGKEVGKILGLRDGDLASLQILKKSVDARKKPDLFYVYTVLAELKDRGRERDLLKRSRSRNVTAARIPAYRIPGCQEPEQEPAGKRGRNGVEEAGGAGLQGTDGGESRSRQTRGSAKGRMRPVIVGTGPAGLFCALALARAGRRPILIDRGMRVDERSGSVQAFWKEGVLNPESNVQFGEGGAGTFSDGKLNTGVKDPYGRIRFVLETFAEAGADREILYSYKPHIGTDVLKRTVASIREEILARGGDVLFETKLTGLSREGDPDHPVWTLNLEYAQKARTEDQDSRFADGEGKPVLPDHRPGSREETSSRRRPDGTGSLQTDRLVLAIGHSARDTFRMLREAGLTMSRKAFAVGLRVQHPQGMIDRALYGAGCPYRMPPSPYKLTHKLADGRGVYSFCMCPGGYVVNASSEPGMLAVNGMSDRDRDSGCANSALVVTVSPEDITEYLADMEDLQGLVREKDPVFAGMDFQRRLERAAYLEGRGKIPVQTFEEYHRSGKRPSEDPLWTARGRDGRSEDLQAWSPRFKGDTRQADLRRILPGRIADAIEEGILAWDRQIPGFADPSTLLAGVESRTSSPVRIERGEDLQAVGFPGIYPCGEGAGYAGGITSAAVDGLRVAEELVSEDS